MATQISSTGWDRIYQASKFINFTSFDYLTVKQSLVDYFKLMHPEFNNWIETDEFVTILEAFAYVSELYSYRLDMIGNENILSTAQRRDSILNLAKFISYRPSRNTPGIGLVKITSVKTDEDIYDINGNNLRNTAIIWNDTNNKDWKSQFLSVISASLDSDFGDATPKNRTQVFDQIFEIYSMNNQQIGITNNVIPYTVSLNNSSTTLELVSSVLDQNGPLEQRPGSSSKFNVIYGSDGLGDSSDYTGFFILTKQGTLYKETNTFSGSVLHDTYTVTRPNVNNIDVWVNDSTRPWNEVETTLTQNIVYNNLNDRYIYEVETLDNDKVKIIFGDGEFAEIPYGPLDIWYRASDANPSPIPTRSINNISTNIAYTGKDNSVYNLILTFSLVQPIQNAAASESIEHIRANAPANYYSQNRMVSHDDYNSFLLRDPSILKLKSTVRAYSGQSRFIDENSSDTVVNHFGDNLSLYLDDISLIRTIPVSVRPRELILKYLQEILLYPNFQNFCSLNNIPIFKKFDENLLHDIIYYKLGDPYLSTDTTAQVEKLPITIYYNSTNGLLETTPSGKSTELFNITRDTGWRLKYSSSNIVVNSPTTKFIIEANDTVSILEANLAGERTNRNSTALSKNIVLPVISNTIYDSDPTSIGLYNDNNAIVSLFSGSVTVDYTDINSIINNTIVLNLDSEIDDRYTAKKYSRLFGRVFDEPFDSDPASLSSIEFDRECLVNDITITGDVNNSIGWKESTDTFTKTITITNANGNGVITVVVKDYVYMSRTSITEPFTISPKNLVREWLKDTDKNFTTRYRGRSGLNFLWKHTVPSSSRVDPSSCNIIDSYLITTSYYNGIMSWLGGHGTKPNKPLPHELRMSYGEMLKYKMMTDEVVLRSGELKPIFGKDAISELQANFVVVVSEGNTYSDSQIKTMIVEAILQFFDINYWDFGQTFNFSELSTHIHNILGSNINTVLITPKDSRFSNLFQIHARDNEILVPSISINDIEVTKNLGLRATY